MKKIIGDRGLKAHYELPANHIGIHKLLALLIVISLLVGFVVVYLVLRERQEESFKKFVQAEKAGVYQGVTMSPKINRKTYKYEGEWQVEIAGAGSESMVKTWEGK